MKYLFILISFAFSLASLAQNHAYKPLWAKDTLQQRLWVDSLYNNMSLEEKVGQLFMVDVFSKEPRADIDDLIEKYHIGGIIFSKGGPYRQANLTNAYQKKSKTPLMIAMDAEWGLAMRLDSTYAFPWNMTLGAIKDNGIVKDVAKQIAEHNKRLGVHINFAPVVDINTNPKNPIIGNRSFGENKYNVTAKAKVFVEAFDEVGILSSAKHFPGHGDTDTDSHKTLPSLFFSKERLDSLELFPFKNLIDTNLSSIMVAHLNVPSLESKNNLPTSLSKQVVTGIIKEELGFEGLIFTDALNMKGASNFDKPGEIDLQAFLAGNDILLISENIPLGIKKIVDAYNSRQISEERLAYSVKKILYAKYKIGLNISSGFVDLKNLNKDLNSSKNDGLYMKSMANAITVLKNDSDLLPLSDLESLKIAFIKMGESENSNFLKITERFTNITTIDSDLLLDKKIEQLANFDLVIIGHHTSNASPWKSYRFTQKELVAIHEISLKYKVLLVNFSSPYALRDIKSFVNIKGIIQAYQNSDIAQSAASQIIFGARPAKGKLPVSINNLYPFGSGYSFDEIGRLGYGYSSNHGIKPEFSLKIDSIVNYALKKKMIPGAQVLVAKNGISIYQKNFGYHTYDKKEKVKDYDVYDLASLTKILVSLPLLMELEEQQQIHIDDSLSTHLPELLLTNKSGITIKKMLSHYAQLQSWIPFYIKTLESPENYYSSIPDFKFNIQVAKDMYVRQDFRDSIYLNIIESDLRLKDEYKYSDLPYYFLQRIIERHYNAGLNYLITDRFYDRMGIKHLRYLPLKHFTESQIIPTENDNIFRKQLLKGYVHDQGTALLGGVGGHAGLFGNANDVAQMMQMYLNGGYYAGKRFTNAETIDRYNTCYFCEEDVRRGVGFDKPQLEDEGPTCGCLSMNSFGHSGFTGTYAWADPDEDIVYIFLSNRIHPSAENKDLIKEGIRTEIQRVIYEYLED